MESEVGGARSGSGKGREAFRTISEVAEQLDLPQHVLRFWESKFSQIKPLKRGGNRRYYRPEDVALITAIKKLLHTEGYTIRGVQKLFKAQGIKATVALALGEGSPEDVASDEDVSNIETAQTNPPSAMNAGTTQATGLNVDGLQRVLSSLKQIRAQLD